MRKMTYSQIAKQAGVSVSHVSRIMRGEKEPSLTVLCKIAFVLDMSAAQFIKALKGGKIK